MKQAEKRYLKRTVLTFGLYGAVIYATDSLLANGNLSPAEATALALAPMLPVLLFVKAMLGFYRTLDELQRKVVADAIIAAACIVGFSSFAWGWLEIRTTVPVLPTIWVMPALFAVFGVALPVVSRRYSGPA